MKDKNPENIEEMNALKGVLVSIQDTSKTITAQIKARKEGLVKAIEPLSYEEMWETKGKDPLYAIYQLPDDHEFTFYNLNEMERGGFVPNISAYELKYVGVDKGEDLETIFHIHNKPDRPEPLTMRSLSVSDVIVRYDGSSETANMVDSFGFKELENFNMPVMARGR